MTKLDQAKINEIIRGFIKDSLDEEEEMRINRKRPLTDDEIDDRAWFLGSLQADRREALARSDFKPAANLTDNAIQDYGLDIQKGSEDYNKLARELMKAQIQVLGVEQRRVYGDYDSAEEEALRTKLRREQLSLMAQRRIQQPSATSATMKQIGEDFWNEYSDGWKPRSQTDYRNVIDQIVAGLGPDTQVHTIDYNRIKVYRNGLKDGSLTLSGKPTLRISDGDTIKVLHNGNQVKDSPVRNRHTRETSGIRKQGQTVHGR